MEWEHKIQLDQICSKICRHLWPLHLGGQSRYKDWHLTVTNIQFDRLFVYWSSVIHFDFIIRQRNWVRKHFHFQDNYIIKWEKMKLSCAKFRSNWSSLRNVRCLQYFGFKIGTLYLGGSYVNRRKVRFQYKITISIFAYSLQKNKQTVEFCCSTCLFVFVRTNEINKMWTGWKFSAQQDCTCHNINLIVYTMKYSPLFLI